MNEQLIVKNFGPIKDAIVDFKRVTVFIGPTGGGKSTLAKLAAVFRNDYWQIQTQDTEAEKKNRFDELLDLYQIQDYLEVNGKLNWKQSDASISYTTQQLIHDNSISKRQKRYKQGQELLSNLDTRLANGGQTATPDEVYKLELMWAPDVSICYIPAERAFSAILANSLAGLMLNKIAVPELMLHFLNEFNHAQGKLYSFPLEIPFLNVFYRLHDKQPRLDLGDGGLVELGRSASGMQAVVPMMLVIRNAATNGSVPLLFPHTFIIEEPELNLYPTAQQGLLTWLVEKCTKGENDLTITTHSPYLLAHFNTLLFAHQVAQNHPERADEIAKIVPRESWLDPKEFAAYHVEGQKENGVRSIVNPETGLISYNGLDAIASAEATEFEKLLDINAGLQVEW